MTRPIQNPERYRRQMNLPELGRAGQEKLQNSSVLCIGVGGLGAPASLYLAAAGVGRIGIIDFDRVEESNLQRQILFSASSIGKLKAGQAAEQLKAFNPTIQIESYEEELDSASAARLFPAYDLILDGSDNFETKFLVNDAACKFGKPWIYGSIQGFDGQVSVFNYKDGPCYRCLQPEKPRAHIRNCAQAGVLGVVAGIVGITQALQAIALLTGHENFSPLSGKLWTIDTRTMQTNALILKKNPTCAICAKNPEEIALQYTSPVCGTIPEISVSELQQKPDSVLIDVREAAEWEKGHIDGALLWPLSRIESGEMPTQPKDRAIILHCQRGGRSMKAAQIMHAQGFTNVTNLSGGYAAWIETA